MLLLDNGSNVVHDTQQGTILRLASQDAKAVVVTQPDTEWYPRNMKFYYVYILRNPLKNYIYIGFSEDLKQRVLSHNRGENKSTKSYIPLELIHYEAYRNIKDAKRREMYLKSNKGRTTLITMLKEYLKS